jgi:hypothetical protein
LSFGLREYWGERVVKIIGIEIDPLELVATLTLREAIDQKVGETAKYINDSNGFILLDSNGEEIFENSGIIWEVG